MELRKEGPYCSACKTKGRKSNARLVVYRRPDFYLCSMCAGDKSVDDVDIWLRNKRKGK